MRGKKKPQTPNWHPLARAWFEDLVKRRVTDSHRQPRCIYAEYNESEYDGKEIFIEVGFGSGEEHLALEARITIEDLFPIIPCELEDS